MTEASHRFDNGLRYRDAEHPDQTQFTPRYVLDPVRADLGGKISLDPCTTPDNPTDAERFFTAEDDGLSRSWSDAERIFVNPPYGKAREPWVRKCIEAGLRGQRVVLLIPAATDTRIFREAVLSGSGHHMIRQVVFISGRVKFGTLRPNRRQHASSHPSALLAWNVILDECSELGWRCVVAGWRYPVG